MLIRVASGNAASNSVRRYVCCLSRVRSAPGLQQVTALYCALLRV